MNRLQKKCFFISIGMHGLLLAVLLGSSAFRDKPEPASIPILTMIPANILDQAGAGGGSPEATVAPQPPQPQPQPPAPQVQPPPPTPVVHTPTPVVHQRPPDPVVERTPPKEPVAESTDPAPTPRKPKPHHEIQPSFEPVTAATHKTKVKPTAETSSEESASSSRAEARHLRQQIDQALNNLATGVRNSGAQGTVVDMPGQGGGEAFAGYETVIYNAYYHAWVTPDSVADKLAGANVKIVVARDGTIISAEIINKSGIAVMDRSVEKVLRAVTRLPAFPATSHDEQRSFLIRFNLEAKEGSG